MRRESLPNRTMCDFEWSGLRQNWTEQRTYIFNDREMSPSFLLVLLLYIMKMPKWPKMDDHEFFRNHDKIKFCKHLVKISELFFYLNIWADLFLFVVRLELQENILRQRNLCKTVAFMQPESIRHFSLILLLKRLLCGKNFTSFNQFSTTFDVI